MAAVMSVQLGAYYQETGQSPEDLRRVVIGDRVTAIDTIALRAIARGEVDVGALTPRIASLPFDLVRHELLMTLKPVPTMTILEIVDDIFLPLVLRRT
jgi:hypothetical protein